MNNDTFIDNLDKPIHILNESDISELATYIIKDNEKHKKFIDKYINKLKNMSVEKRLELYEKIYNKYNSEKYINKEYGLGYEPRCDLYDILLDYGSIYGIQLFTGAFVLDETWVINQIEGQGVVTIFERFTKENKYHDYDFILVYLNSKNDNQYSFDKNGYHFELIPEGTFGVVCYIDTYEFNNNTYKHVLCTDVYEDDGHWYMAENPVTYDALWLNSKIKCLEKINQYIKNVLNPKIKNYTYDKRML